MLVNKCTRRSTHLRAVVLAHFRWRRQRQVNQGSVGHRIPFEAQGVVRCRFPVETKVKLHTVVVPTALLSGKCKGSGNISLYKKWVGAMDYAVPFRSQKGLLLQKKSGTIIFFPSTSLFVGNALFPVYLFLPFLPFFFSCHNDPSFPPTSFHLPPSLIPTLSPPSPFLPSLSPRLVDWMSPWTNQLQIHINKNGDGYDSVSCSPFCSWKK